MSDLINALLALGDSRPVHNEARSFYTGEQSEVFVSDVVRKVLGSKTNKFKINFSRVPVTARLNRLKISSVSVTDDAAASEVLSDSWVQNMLDQEAHDIHESALVEGETYAIVWPSAGDAGVDVFHNDTNSTRLFYSAENPRVKSYAIKTWVEESGNLRVNLYYADRIERYITKSNKPGAELKDDSFIWFVEDGQDGVLDNPYGVIPVFHFRTERQHGRPVHADAFGPQRLIDKLTVSHSAVIEISSFPQRYILEHPEKANGLPSDSDFAGDFTTDEDDSGTTVDRLASGPGQVWWLRGVQSVGQFEPANPATFTDPLMVYVNSMATATQTPLHSFNVGNMPSGEALRVAEAPLVQSVEDLQLTLGATWRELFTFVLMVEGNEGGTVSVTWTPAATYDDSAAWQVVSAKLAAGLPFRQAMLEAGYTDEQIDEFEAAGPVVPVEASAELA